MLIKRKGKQLRMKRGEELNKKKIRERREMQSKKY